METKNEIAIDGEVGRGMENGLIEQGGPCLMDRMAEVATQETDR